jgi:hypothetical protein
MLFRRLAGADIEVRPWEIQLEVANKLRMIADARESLMEQLDAIKKLPAVLLHQAFRGELG